MNGRCVTDPFDQARNVCGLCYGEFCLNCLMDVKGRKHPLCRECAIVASGVRAGAKPALRGAKRTAAARRTALKEAPIQESFQFFDAAPPEAPATDSSTADAEDADEVAPKAKRKRRSKAATDKTATAKEKKTKQKPAKKRAAKKKPATAKSTSKTSSKKSPDEDTSTAVAKAASTKAGKAKTAGGSAASNDSDTDTETDAADERAMTASAVDQLGSIRELETNSDGTHPDSKADSFRKPRPFIKSKAERAAAESKPKRAPGSPAESKLVASKVVETPPTKSRSAGSKSPASKPAEPVSAQDRPKPMAKRQSKTGARQAEQQAAAKKAPAKKQSLFGGEARKSANTPTAKAAQPEPAPQQATSNPAAVNQAPAKQTPKRAEATPKQAKAQDEPAISGELISPFSVAPPPSLPRRRASPDKGQDPYERSDPDSVGTTAPDQALSRRRSDSKAAPKPSKAPAETQASPPERRSSDDSAEPDEPSPMRPPAWTQRPRGRKDDVEVPTAEVAQPEAKAKADSSAGNTPADTKPLPKRRRSS